MSVRNAGRHPATDLETAGTQRVRDGDGYITTGKIQRARRALRHRLRRDVGKPGADALPVGRAAEAMFATLGFNPVPGGVIRAGGHHAVLPLTQHLGDPRGFLLRRSAKGLFDINFNLPHSGMSLQRSDLALRHLAHRTNHRQQRPLLAAAKAAGQRLAKSRRADQQCLSRMGRDGVDHLIQLAVFPGVDNQYSLLLARHR